LINISHTSFASDISFLLSRQLCRVLLIFNQCVKAQHEWCEGLAHVVRRLNTMCAEEQISYNIPSI